MPYEKLSELPEAVQAMPKQAQEIWMAACNAALKQYEGDEEKAFATAWAAVKKKYKKEGDKWVMMDEKELMHSDGENWIEAFRTGIHTDSQGHTSEWTREDLARIADGYDPGRHEAPVVIGHPREDEPAYGWVKKLKAEGDRLLARLGDLAPEFVDWVRKGRYKKVSIALYPDLTLRHIGFLGATPPAIKGLKQAAFSQKTAWREIAICPPGQKTGGNQMSFKEKLLTFFTQFVSRMPEDIDLDVPTLPDKPKGKTFSEAELQAEIKKASDEAAAAAKEAAKKEFAEQQRLERLASRKDEAREWCDLMIKAGSLTPALVKYGVPEMLLHFAEAEDLMEFGEKKEKATLYDRFKGLFEKQLPKMISFQEIAGRNGDLDSGNTAGAKLEALTMRKMQELKCNYSRAFSEVQREYPELAKEYAEDLKG